MRILLATFIFFLSNQSHAGYSRYVTNEFSQKALFTVSYSIHYESTFEAFSEANIRKIINSANSILIQCGIIFVAKDFNPHANLRSMVMGKRKIFFINKIDHNFSSNHQLGRAQATSEKNQAECMTGAIVINQNALRGDPGQVLAHELLHSLGQDHVNDEANLMNPYNSPKGYNLTMDQCVQSRGVYNNSGGLLVC